MTRRTKGFTLIEVLLAAVIVAMLITVLAQGVASAARRERYTGRHHQAVQYASQVMAAVETGEDVATTGQFPADSDMGWEISETTVQTGLTETEVIVSWLHDGTVQSVRLVRWRRDE